MFFFSFADFILHPFQQITNGNAIDKEAWSFYLLHSRNHAILTW